MIKSRRAFFCLTSIFSILFIAIPALAEDTKGGAPAPEQSPDPTTKPTITFSADGTKTTITDKPDGTRIAKIDKPDGTTIISFSGPDGTVVKTINKPDGSTIITKTTPEGGTEETIIGTDGSIITKKIPPSSEEGVTSSSSELPSPSPSPSSTASPAPYVPPKGSSTPSPSPTPPASQPLVAPFYIDRTPIDSNQGPDAVALISTSCITADQWAAFLNAVAKYADPHGLYYPAMGNPPQPQLDSSPAPKTAQILRTLGEDKRSLRYIVVNPDKVAGVAASPELTNKDLPITYINLFDAARFCNWLHHGQPVVEESRNADDVTEGGAYLLDDGLDTYWRDGHKNFSNYKDQYQDQFKAITLLPTALWRIPPYISYNGVHHGAGENNNTPDFTEPEAEFAGQVVPSEEVNGFFDTHPKNPLGKEAPYEWTSTHISNPSEALFNHRAAAFVGSYYKVKSASEELEEVATTSQSPSDRGITKDLDRVTSFRVMPLGAVAAELPPKEVSSDPTPISEGSLEPSPEGSPLPEGSLEPSLTSSGG